jgi:cobalt-zinc-cadmium efflux system outer membrane protein
MVLEEVMQQALNKSPELSVLRSLLERADANLSFAKSGRLPGVELRYQELRDPEIRQTMTGVAIQIPLLDQRQGPVAEAAAERLRAQTRLDGAILEMRQRVLMAWKSYEMARAAVEALGRGAIPEAEAALRVAEAAYRFGERGILEVLDAQRVLRSVRADLIQARFELQAARITLDKLAARYIATAQ